MSVFIDIPGIGTVEAKGAASEATLKELLSATTGTVRNNNNSNSGSKSSPLLGATKQLNGAFIKLGGVAGKVASGLISVVDSAMKMGDATLNATNSLANLDGSAAGAAEIFSNFPIVGKALVSVASAADKVAASFNAASQSGATFGGSIINFSRAASEAGMNMAEFGALVARNGEGMLAFGSNTEDGAKNFANVSKSLRTTGSDLYALGMSTQEINSGLASYGALLRQQGLQGKKSNAELAVGAKNYLKEMDALAKITGEERSAKEAQAKQLAADAQFQASMMGMNEEVRASFRNTVLGLPGPLQSFTKDMLANGVATTEENQKLMAMMPQSAAMLQQMQAKMVRGEQVTTEERNRLNNLMKDEGGRNLQNIKQAGAASAELGGMVNSLAATQQINIDGVKEATEAQKKAQANTDGFNKKMQEFQQRISTVSNTFQGLLATSGVLDVLMNAFDAVAKLAEEYLVPAFNIVSSIVMKVGNGMMLLLAPVIEYISEKFGSGGLGGTITFIDGLMNDVFDVLGGVVRGAILAFDGLWTGVMTLLDPLKRMWTTIFGVTDTTDGFGATLIQVGAFIGDVFKVLGKVIGFVIDFLNPLWQILGVVVTAFKGVIDFIANFGDYMKDFQSIIESVADGLMRFLNKVTFGAAGIDEAERKKREDDRKAAKEERIAARDAAANRQTAELKEDKKKFAEQKVTTDQLTGLASKEAKAKEAATKGPFRVKYQILGRKAETRNVTIPEPTADQAEQEAAIKKVLAAEYKVPVAGVKILPQNPIEKPVEFDGSDVADAEKKGPMTVEKVRALKKPELIEFATANEFDLGEDPNKISEEDLREIVAMMFEDRQKGLEAEK